MAHPTAQSAAAEWLAQGDAFYVDERYELALQAFEESLVALQRNDGRDEDDAAVLLNFRALSHKSGAHYQLGQYDLALEAAQAATRWLSTRACLSGLPLRLGEREACWQREGFAAYKLERFDYARTALEQAAAVARQEPRGTASNERDDASLLYPKWIELCERKMQHQQGKKKPTDGSEGRSTTSLPINASNSAATIPEPQVQPTSPRPVPSTEDGKSSIGTSAQPATTDSSTIRPPITGANAAPRVVSTRPSVPKYQYYQNDKVMTIVLPETNVQAADLHVEFAPKQLLVELRKSNIWLTVIRHYLAEDVDPAQSKTVIKQEKVLIKLRKAEEGEWHELLGKAAPPPSSISSSTLNNTTPAGGGSEMPESAPDASSSRPGPYASPKDWHSIEKDIEQAEEKEKPQGDDAMNKLFEQIYRNADEDTRRAMIKSYQTSGGTVLSTNWAEVADKDYETERTAPKGMEWKNWEGDKLPMKKDDYDDDGNER